MTGEARTFRVDLGYDGGGFVGSQRQPGARTVQESLERALAEVSGQPVAIDLAGRTDRGVHAVGQVGSFAIAWSRSVGALARALQAVTPDDLVVRDVRAVAEGFHARFDAEGREYRYRIWNGSAPVLLRHCVWWVRRPLDLAAMERASQALVGRHDFASFAGDGVGVPGSGIDTTRTISEVAWRCLTCEIEPGAAGRLLEFRVAADGFLPHMVRNLVGALAQVGRGRQDSGWIEDLLALQDRRRAPEPAPAVGLTLWQVRYAQEEARAAADQLDMDTDVDRLGVEGYEDVFAEGE